MAINLKKYRLRTRDLALAAAFAVAAGSLLVFPGASFVPTLAAYVAVLAVVMAVYGLCRSCNQAGRYVLLTVWAVLCVGVSANVYYFTTRAGCDTVTPMLLNDDSARWYYEACRAIKEPGYNHSSMALLFTLILRVFGMSIMPLIIINMLAVLLTIALTGHIAATVCGGSREQAEKVSVTAMVMLSAVCYFLALGTVILKDALVAFGVTLAVTASLREATHHNVRSTVISAVLLAIGCVPVAMLRPLYLFVLAVIIVAFFSLRRRPVSTAVLLLIICLAAVGVRMLIESGVPAIAVPDDNVQCYIYSDRDHDYYNTFANSYMADFPWWKRLLMLPLTAGVQYFIPFFWTIGNGVQFGYTMAYAHIGIPWYLIGGLIIYYVLFDLRRAPSLLLRLTVAGCLLWFVPAFTAAGLVSRYWLPFLPMLVPCAAIVWQRRSEERYLGTFYKCYIALVAIVLLVAYNLQYS